jgi:hypothetical protein
LAAGFGGLGVNEPYVRLHLFFATENDRAIILRQGPSKHYRMILWHRNTDTFEDGQWIRQRIYLDMCDLSPDGRHFIYFTLNGHWSDESKGAYTVISRPPYFTALSLFPEGSTWGGGGRFLNNKRYVAVGASDIIGRDDGLQRLLRLEKTTAYPTGLKTKRGKPAALETGELERLEAPIAASRTSGLDHYDTMGGKLYRRRGDEFELIRDFNEMTFERVRAPYDWREERSDTEESRPWHPLDNEGPQ